MAISNLQSPDSRVRAEAAYWLSEHACRSDEKAWEARPAVPYLIAILDDQTTLEPLAHLSSQCGSSMVSRVSRTSAGQLAARALGSITGQDFGQDQKKWRNWWADNGDKR